jgi:hypothetical protein
MAVNNKPASAYVGRYKEGLPKPDESCECIDTMDMSVGNLSKGNAVGNKVNSHGTLEMRGFGAATKGKKISGKMG